MIFIRLIAAYIIGVMAGFDLSVLLDYIWPLSPSNNFLRSMVCGGTMTLLVIYLALKYPEIP